MLSSLLNREVTILPAGGDPFTTRGALQQTRREELSGHGPFSVTEWRLFLPGDVKLTTADRVEVDGDRYEVTGGPWPVHDERTGRPHHIEATLKVTGSDRDLGGASGEEEF